MPISKIAPEWSVYRHTYRLSAFLSLYWVIVTLFAYSIIFKHCISLEQQSGVDNALIVSFVRLTDVNTSEICLLLFPFTLNNEANFVLVVERITAPSDWAVLELSKSTAWRLSTAGVIVGSNENVNDIVKV